MSLDAVRALLNGWKAHAKLLSKYPPHVYHVWDFVPPDGSADKPIRMTFCANEGLIVWGEPAPSKSPNGF